MKRLAKSRVWWASLDADLEAKVWTCTKLSVKLTPRISLVPRLSRTCKRGSGVLSDFSCHIWQDIAPRSESLNQILECVIICAWHKPIIFWTKLEVEKAYLAARSQLFPRNFAVLSSHQETGVSDVKWHSLCCRPAPCDKKCCSEQQTLRFSRFGDETTPQWLCWSKWGGDVTFDRLNLLKPLYLFLYVFWYCI